MYITKEIATLDTTEVLLVQNLFFKLFAAVLNTYPTGEEVTDEVNSEFAKTCETIILNCGLPENIASTVAECFTEIETTANKEFSTKIENGIITADNLRQHITVTYDVFISFLYIESIDGPKTMTESNYNNTLDVSSLPESSREALANVIYALSDTASEAYRGMEKAGGRLENAITERKFNNKMGLLLEELNNLEGVTPALLEAIDTLFHDEVTNKPVEKLIKWFNLEVDAKTYLRFTTINDIMTIDIY